MKRAYVKSKDHEKMRIYAARRDLTLTEAYGEVINKLLDEDAKEKKPYMEEEDYEILKETAETMGMTTTELVKYAISTVRMLFSNDLSFSDAIKPLPEIGKILEEKRKRK